MAEPIRKTVSIIDKDFSPDSDGNRILSVELLPDSIVYAMLDTSASMFYALEAFEIDKPRHWMRHGSEWLQSVIEGNSVLSDQYQQVHLSLNASRLVLLPAGLNSDMDHKNAYNFSCGNASDALIRTDTLSHLQGFGVYSIPKDLHQLIDATWPGCVCYHSGVVFIESILAFAKKKACPDIVLHIRSSSFDVLLFEDASLTFYQAFQYQQLDDLLYYLFYVLDVFDKEAAALNLMIAGEIGPDSDMCRRLNTYFKEMRFFNRNDAYTYSPSFDILPDHFYANLLHIETCG